MKKRAAMMICIFSVIIFLCSLFALPQEIPLHFTIEGEIDVWGSKYTNVIFCLVSWILYFMLKSDLKNGGKDFFVLFMLIVFFNICLGVVSVNAYMICNGFTNSSVDMVKCIFGLFGVCLTLLGVIGCVVSSLRHDIEYKLYFVIGIAVSVMTLFIKSNIVYILLFLMLCLCGKIFANIYKGQIIRESEHETKS